MEEELKLVGKCLGHDEVSLVAHQNVQALDYANLHTTMYSGDGIGGILSVIGAGVASDSNHRQNEEMAPVPDELSTILMTDSNEKQLNKCIHFLRTTKFPELKVELGLLDWTKNVQDNMKDKFDFILGCDCSDDVSSLAKTVAHSLKKSSSKDCKRNEPPFCGSFIHIGPENRANLKDLVSELDIKYSMNTAVEDIVLQRIELEPFIQKNARDTDAQIRQNEIESRGYIQFGAVETAKYKAVIGYHDVIVEQVSHHSNITLRSFLIKCICGSDITICFDYSGTPC